MPKARNPRHGSMQFWPRKRSKRSSARVRSWADIKDVKALGFAGYKAGMTHLIAIDNRPTSMTKGEEISIPVTVIECPPIKVYSIKFYKKFNSGLRLISEIVSEKNNKELARKIPLPKKTKAKIEDIKDYDDIRLTVYTQPKLTGIGKKRPEVFELGIGGSKEEKLNFAKEKLGKEISIGDVFSEGEYVDVHAITKGKGFQGPVKRFGIAIRNHKSEKTVRGPGSLGGWISQAHVMYRVAHAGQMGMHQRTHYNNLILKIGTDPKEINPKGGFVRFGNVKSSYILIKGSIPGPAKRIIKLAKSIRGKKSVQIPTIQSISLESKQ